MFLGINIDFHPDRFIHRLAAGRATRKIKELLDTLGHERIAWAIANNKDLVSFYPPEMVHGLAAQNPVPKEYMDEFPDSEIYTWIPGEYRAFIEQQPGGKEWALRQVGLLRGMSVTI